MDLIIKNNIWDNKKVSQNNNIIPTTSELISGITKAEKNTKKRVINSINNECENKINNHRNTVISLWPIKRLSQFFFRIIARLLESLVTRIVIHIIVNPIKIDSEDGNKSRSFNKAKITKSNS